MYIKYIRRHIQAKISYSVDLCAAHEQNLSCHPSAPMGAEASRVAISELMS